MVNYYNYLQCPYKNCNLNCRNFTQHRARYASIKNDKTTIKKLHTKSNRVNYDVLRKLYQNDMFNLKNNSKINKNE